MEDFVLPEKEQSKMEQKRIRERYRTLINELQEHQEDLINPESDQLDERLKEANEMFKPVRRPREAMLDAHAMSLIANMGRMKAQALHTEFIRFQPLEFASKLKQHCVGTKMDTGSHAIAADRSSVLDWHKLGKLVQPLFLHSPPFQFMLGSFEKGPKPQKVRQRRIPKDNENVTDKETVPTQLKDFNDSGKNEATTEEVERIHEILKEKYRENGDKPLCYFEFVLNPDSFGHTVENIFYVSFLTRDDLAQIILDDYGLPIIKPVTPKEASVQKQNGEQTKQTIVSITPKEWKKLVETFEIDTAVIPPREIYANASASNSHR